jgi:hypothetical protein
MSKTDTEQPKLYWPNWEKNPREIKAEDFKRLQKQIQELGEYKPLLVTDDGEVIGGNMRLRAYKALGYKDCWVSIVNPKDEAEKVKYALSDNDNVGYYLIDELSTLVEGLNLNEDELKEFKISMGKEMSLEKMLEGDMFKETNDESIEYAGEFQVVVDCENEEEQQKNYDELTKKGYKCRVLTI